MKFSEFTSDYDVNEGIKDKIRDTAIKVGRKVGIKKAKDANTSKEKEYMDCLDDLVAELEDMVNFEIDPEDIKTEKTDSGMTAVIRYDSATEDFDVENKRYTKMDWKRMNKFIKDVRARHKCSVWITKNWWHEGSRYCSVAFS